MSLRVINAVHDSRIEPRLRHLAQSLAIFANDDGSDIWPGVVTLMKILGSEESVVREGLEALVTYGVLERDGYHGHTRRFRLNLEKLAAYTPSVPTRAAWRAQHWRKRPPKPCAEAEGSNDAQPYAVAEGSAPETLRRGGVNPPPWRSQPYAVAELTLRRGGPDLNDLQDLQEVQPTGADAPDLAGENQKTTGPAELASSEVYLAIAKDAHSEAMHEKDRSPIAVTSRFDRGCVARHVAVPPATTRDKAIAAALDARDDASQAFVDQMRRVGYRVTR